GLASQDRDAGSNPAGATNLFSSRFSAKGFRSLATARPHRGLYSESSRIIRESTTSYLSVDTLAPVVADVAACRLRRGCLVACIAPWLSQNVTISPLPPSRSTSQ